MVTVECANCGAVFCVQTKRIKRAKELFCSTNCHDVLRKKRYLKGIETKLGIQDLKSWLMEKYIVEKLTTREIAYLIYGNRNMSSSVLRIMDDVGIERRTRSDSVTLQWEGNEERRKNTSKIAKLNLTRKDVRDKLRRIMNTPEFKRRASEAKLGEKNPMHGVTGKNHPQWNPNRTHDQRVSERKTFKDRRWRMIVFERDSYSCQCCGDDRGGNLVAHHLDSYDWCVSKRYSPDNGITLCEKCHKTFHKLYGYGNNRKEQFDEFLNVNFRHKVAE